MNSRRGRVKLPTKREGLREMPQSRKMGRWTGWTTTPTLTNTPTIQSMATTTATCIIRTRTRTTATNTRRCARPSSAGPW